MSRALLLLVPTFLLCVSAGSAEPGSHEVPAIHVTGEAEIRVIPDIAILKVTVQHCGTDLIAIRRANQQVAREVLAAVAAVGGKAADQASTPTMSFPRRYDCPDVDEKQRELGLTVKTELTLRLQDLKQIDPLLDALSSRREVQLGDVEYRTTELRRYRDQVRASAIRAAREKAQALAREIGQSIGPAIQIVADTDAAGGFWSWSQYGSGAHYRGMATQNVMMDAGDRDGGDSQLAASGKITVRATVSVRFALNP